MMPKKLYKNVRVGFSREKIVFKIEFNVPARPKNETKPSATRRVGKQSGIEESERRNLLPKKERFAVKYAEESPIKSATTVEQSA